MKEPSMTLENSLIKLSEENIDEKNEWYDWSFDPARIPFDLHLPPGGNSFERNKILKKELHTLLRCNPRMKHEVISYYICVWGGIRTNREGTIRRYVQKDPQDLIEFGDHGISSWSKAISIIDPDRYAIYDARVATALNALQIIDSTTEKMLFPMPQSRNTKIAPAQKTIKQIARQENWIRPQKDSFYKRYLNLLQNVSRQLKPTINADITTLEMLLFAKAEELVAQICKHT